MTYRNNKGRFINKKEYNLYAKIFVIGIVFGIFVSLACLPDTYTFARAETITPEIVETIAPLELAHKIDILSQKYNVDRVLAEKIIFCESSFYRTALNGNKDGSVDQSYWQINNKTWNATLKKKGFDPMSLEAGFWILANYGTTPWNSSRHCWKD